MDAETGLPPAPGNEDTAANTAGAQPAAPAAGFGQLWRKELSMTLASRPGPEPVTWYWRQNFHRLWPEDGTMYLSHRGIEEGELAGIDLAVGPARLSTGVLVTDSTPTGFTLVPPEGHMFAGWNRFEAADVAGGTRVTITIEMRASDPLYEFGLMFGGHKKEERFWAAVLRNLASHFGEQPPIYLTRKRLDVRRKWRHAGNIRRNAFIRTSLRRLRRGIGWSKRGV